MQVQLDNCAKDNENKFAFAYYTLLVAKGFFKDLLVSFVLVGHMHDDIYALLGQ